jgi:hypothetical protein
MKKIHVAAVALLLAFAAVFGTIAATRTAGLGTPARQDALVQQRSNQLDAFAASLHRQLAQASSVHRTAAAPAPRIVYHRPPPIVVTTHTHHSDDDGSESGHEGGDD